MLIVTTKIAPFELFWMCTLTSKKMKYFYVLLLFSCYAVKCMSTCSHLYGHEPCKTFVPAPPGKTPPCARPGQTFCEFPDKYPSQLINYLIQKWRFDHTTMLRDESQEEFSSYFFAASPKPEYGPPGFRGYGPRPGDERRPEPIVVPTPEQPLTAAFFPERGNLVYQERLRNGQFFTYKYPQNFPLVDRPNYHSYYYDLHQGHGQYNNRIWKRRADARQKRSLKFKRSGQIVDRDANVLSSNVTLSRDRRKRQAANAQPLCTASSKFIMPRAALNNKGNWMYVVNMPELDTRYTQLVKSETCLSRTCSALCGLPQGYSSRCEQKYIQKRLVALDGAGDKLYNDVFWFPSCCVCTLSNS